MIPPNIIDGKRVLSEISSGGHATVFKVWDEVLETHYAIKVMKPCASDNADRFLTEAKVLAQIKHPNIPTILNYGKTDDNRPFIRMEYVDGKDIRSLITEKGKLPPPIALSIILQAARALQYAHNLEYEIYGEKRKGIIHRDIKPANILVGIDGVVKLIDFGIAKVDKLSIHTSASTIIGTYHYMAPEQLDPPDDDPKLDSRGDIYSLGCVLYECLTGACQFDADTISIILSRKQSGKYDISGLNELPPIIKKIITISTATEKGDRYADITQMISDLEAAIDNTSANNSVEEGIKKYLDTGEYHAVKKTKFAKINWVLFLIFIIIIAGVFLWKIDFLNNVGNSVNRINIIIDSTSNAKDDLPSPIIDTAEKNEKIEKRDLTISQKRPKQIINHVSRSPSLPKVATTVKNDSIKVTSAFEMFQKGRYQDVVALLAGKKNNELSDSMFLILCGSLIIVEPSKLGEYLFSRTIRDGYHHYLRGRFYYLNGKWEQARTCFLKALTIRTIIPCDESTLYFLVNSAFNLYQRTPNISNREFFEGQKNEYLVKYCEKSENTNCMVVQNLMLK